MSPIHRCCGVHQRSTGLNKVNRRFSLALFVSFSLSLKACLSHTLTENSMFFLSWLTARGSGTGSVCFSTDTDSPVKMDWSTRSVVERMEVRRMSAGTLSPTGRNEGGDDGEENQSKRPIELPLYLLLTFALQKNCKNSSAIPQEYSARQLKMLHITTGSFLLNSIMRCSSSALDVVIVMTRDKWQKHQAA